MSQVSSHPLRDGKRSGYNAFQTEVNIELWCDISGFIAKTTAIDSRSVRQKLENQCIWYMQTNNNSITEQYGFRYFGELLERFEDRAGSDIRDIRAIALAMAWSSDLLTDDMFVADQRTGFIRKIKAMAAGDVYLTGALYMLGENGDARLKELEGSEYTRTEELLFVTSLYDDFGRAFDIYKPQLLKLLGDSRSIPVYGNMGLYAWFIKKLAPIIKNHRAKDMALFRALTALPSSFVKPESKPHGVLLASGYTAEEIIYANGQAVLYKPTKDSLEFHGIVAEKTAVELCRTHINSEKAHTQDTYDYLSWLLDEYSDFNIKLQGYSGLFNAIKGDIRITNPTTFLWLYRRTKRHNENHNSIFLFDITDDKWDILSRELSAKQYTALLDNQFRHHSDLTPEQISDWIKIYDKLTGTSYLDGFVREYSHFRDSLFATMVESGLIDLITTFAAILDITTLKHDASDDEIPPILKYIQDYIRGVHSREAFEFMRWFLSEYSFDDMDRLFAEKGWGCNNAQFFQKALYEGPVMHHGDSKQRFNVKRAFLSDDEHRELLSWLDDYMYSHSTEQYVEYCVLMLLDPFITTLFSHDELKRVYVAIRDTDVAKKNNYPRELRDLYLSESELQAERDAEKIREAALKQRELEQEIQKIKDELSKAYNGTCSSLLKFLDGYRYSWAKKTADAHHLAAEYLGRIIADNDNRFDREELGRVVQFGGKLLKEGAITFEALKKYMLTIEEETDNAIAKNDGTIESDQTA